MRLSWGDSKKLDHQKYAEPDAEHVEPGQTFVVTVPKMYMKGLRAQQRLRPHTTKKLLLRFEKTYFGDGTGFEVENWWKDFRGKGPPPKPDKKHHSTRLKEERSHSSTSTTEPICGGGNCFRWVVPDERSPSSCYDCDTINAYSSPDAACSVLKHDRFDCDGDGIRECYDEALDVELTQSTCTWPDANSYADADAVANTHADTHTYANSMP